MRILLTANAPYAPPRGGSTRSNLAWFQELADEGHDCRVVAAAPRSDNPSRAAQLHSELQAEDLRRVGGADGVEIIERGRIRIYSVQEPAHRSAVLREQVAGFQPDWVLVSSEDVGHLLIREAHAAAPGRVVYLAHTPQFYPFGPASWNPDPEAARLVAQSAAVIAIGKRTGAYVDTHAGCRSVVIHPPIYGIGPWPFLGRFEDGFITMINPCAVKGISIFVELARALPHYPFAALPSWGTTSVDRRLLESLPNVNLLPPCRDIEELLAKTRVLLMPSLWLEGFGLIVMEAMLRGIPVVSSDSGGLLEAKMGTGYVIPVRPIERYEPVFDEQNMPRPVIPEQNLEPWADAIRTLLTDRGAYTGEARHSRDAAVRFVTGLKRGELGRFLQSLEPARERRAETPAAGPKDVFAKLSPEKRALLLQRLRNRSGKPA